MSSLNQFSRLDRDSSTFHDQVSSILYGEEYKQWVQTVQGDDLVALVDHLDKVRFRVLFLSSLLLFLAHATVGS